MSLTSWKLPKYIPIVGNKTVVTEEFEFDFRDKSLMMEFLEIWNIWEQLKFLSVDYFVTSWKIPIEMLMDENKPLVTEIYEIEFKDKSI